MGYLFLFFTSLVVIIINYFRVDVFYCFLLTYLLLFSNIPGGYLFIIYYYLLYIFAHSLYLIDVVIQFGHLSPHDIHASRCGKRPSKYSIGADNEVSSKTIIKLNKPKGIYISFQQIPPQ